MTTPAEAEALLFADTLACEERRPAAFLPQAVQGAAALAASGEALLRALAVVEDGPRSEEPEPGGDHVLPRIEAKLDLLTTLVASLCRHDDADAIQALQWSARGACLVLPDAPAAGSAGLFRIRPADWLPSPLLLPAREIAREASPGGGGVRSWLRFDPMPAALEAALERHLFRIHRRAIAESRRAR